MSNVFSLVSFIGRVVFGLYFVWGAIYLLGHWTESYHTLSEYSMKAIPVWLILAFIFQLLGGLSLVFGCWTRRGALLITIYLLFLLCTGLNWSEPQHWGFSGWMTLNLFAEHIALTAAALAFIGFGSGNWSIDRRSDRKG